MHIQKWNGERINKLGTRHVPIVTISHSSQTSHVDIAVEAGLDPLLLFVFDWDGLIPFVGTGNGDEKATREDDSNC